MRNLKSYIAGLVTGLLLVSVPIFADSYTKAIDALVNFAKIQVNGADVQSDNFVVDGKTYVWIRDVANMMGKDIAWDESTNTANIVEKGAVSSAGIVAKVEDTSISSRSVASMVKSLGNTVPKEQAKSTALDNLINLKVSTVEAKKQGLTVKQEDIDNLKRQLEQIKAAYGEENFKSMLDQMSITEQEYIDMNIDSMLEQQLYKKLSDETQITDEQLQKTYEKNKDSFMKVTAKHILIKTVDDQNQPLSKEGLDAAQKKANEIYQSLLEGVKFDKAMAAFSQDEGSKNDTAGMTFGKGEMVKSFEDASFTQNIGQYYPPVKSEFGYHIILVTKREATPFEEVKEKCKSLVFGDIYSEYVKTLRGTMNIEIFDDVLKGIEA